MLVYFIASIVSFYLILRAFIKIKYHFWSRQPVFHIYDLHHWVRCNKVIDHELPSMNEYVDIINIKTVSIEEMSENDISCFCSFIKNHYLRTKNAEYIPEKQHIIEYMKSSNHTSYVSIHRHRNQYNSINLLNTNEELKENDICSVITSRILHITFKSTKSIPLYYIDNLCVHPAMRKKKIAPKAIQTLHYNLRRMNEDVKTFLFKREGEMTAIVPLTTFEVRGFTTSMIPRLELPHASMTVIEITPNNLMLFVELIKGQRETYECVVVPEITNLMNTIKEGIISLYGILEHGKLIAVYVFRDAATFYDGKRGLELIVSISACHFHEIFYAGFTQALHSCCKKWNTSILTVDGVGGNEIITKSIGQHNNIPLFTSKSAFFLYNYASYTLPPDKCFLLC